MSERRRARGGAVSGPHSGIPDPLLSRSHPIWADLEAVRRMFGQYLTKADLSGLRRHNLHGRVLAVWALRNGYESEQYPGSPDWRRLKAAGLNGPPDRPEDTSEESRLRQVAWLDELDARWKAQRG